MFLDAMNSPKAMAHQIYPALVVGLGDQLQLPISSNSEHPFHFPRFIFPSFTRTYHLCRRASCILALRFVQSMLGH